MNNFERVETIMSDVKMRDEMKSFKSPISGYEIMKKFNLSEGVEIGLFKNKIEMDAELIPIFRAMKNNEALARMRSATIPCGVPLGSDLWIE